MSGPLDIRDPQRRWVVHTSTFLHSQKHLFFFFIKGYDLHEGFPMDFLRTKIRSYLLFLNSFFQP